MPIVVVVADVVVVIVAVDADDDDVLGTKHGHGRDAGTSQRREPAIGVEARLTTPRAEMQRLEQHVRDVRARADV